MKKMYGGSHGGRKEGVWWCSSGLLLKKATIFYKMLVGLRGGGGEGQNLNGQTLLTNLKTEYG